MTKMAAALVLLSVTIAPPAYAGHTDLFVLIVASNDSPGPEMAPLRYADDDGARYHRLFSPLAKRTILLALLDPETQERYPDLADQARVPTRENILLAMEELNRDMAASRSQGRRAVFTFIYSGHGTIDQDNQASVVVFQGKLTRRDIYERLVGPSHAEVNHLIIDACNAYYMVRRRGGYPDDRTERTYDEEIKAYLSQEDLDGYPNTGVVVSTSSRADSHEWSLFEAGIFSHELRSGLAGSADVNDDGRISYPEILAYLGAANAQIKVPRARVNVFARPPVKNLAEPLIDLAQGGPQFTLRVDASLTGRIFIEDERGGRVLDFHKDKETAFSLILPSGGPFFIRGEGWEAQARLQAGVPLSLKSLPRQRAAAPEVARRGAVAEDFRSHLYATPFGKRFYDGYLAAANGPEGDKVVTVSAAGKLRPWAWASLSLAVAAGATSAIFGILVQSNSGEFERRFNENGQADLDLKSTTETQAAVSNIMLGTAITSALASLVLFIVSFDKGTTASSTWTPKASPLPGGATVGVGMNY